VVIVFALLAAFCNAVNEATQHVASIASPPRSSGRRLVVYLFRNPLWLFGWVALIGAFVFQALALHNGLISVVQPLLATELVFMLVLRRFWIRQAIRPITWGAAALTCVSLTVFIVMSEPRGGQPSPVSGHWLAATLGCCAVAAVLAVLARWGSAARRAALYAAAAAVMWALVATFIKATTDTLAQFGVAGMFTHWPVYALALGSAAAVILQQAALHVGPLRISQPFLVIVDPIVSIALSVWLFGEHFTSDATVLAVAAIAFAAMCAGVVLLTQTAPATMEADAPGAAASEAAAPAAAAPAAAAPAAAAPAAAATEAAAPAAAAPAAPEAAATETDAASAEAPQDG
jgi:drug/metabolite transporter (DMT)-like permease